MKKKFIVLELNVDFLKNRRETSDRKYLYYNNNYSKWVFTENFDSAYIFETWQDAESALDKHEYNLFKANYFIIVPIYVTAKQ